MRYIGTQTELFGWLGETVKFVQPTVCISTNFIDEFDRMIEQFGRTGSWDFDGSLAQFSSEFGVAVAGKGETHTIGFAALPFMLSIAACGVENGAGKRLRVHYPAALAGLLAIIGENTEFLFLDLGDRIQCTASYGFEGRRQLRVGFDLDDVELARLAIAKLFGNQYVIEQDVDEHGG